MQSSFKGLGTQTPELMGEELLAAISQPEARDQKKIMSLIRDGASLSIRNSKGDTALIVAARNGYLDIARALIDRDAGLNDKNLSGNTALMMAAANGHIRVVAALIGHGAALDEYNMWGTTALVWAKRNRYAAIVSMIEDAARLKKEGYPSVAAPKRASGAGR